MANEILVVAAVALLMIEREGEVYTRSSNVFYFKETDQDCIADIRKVVHIDFLAT